MKAVTTAGTVANLIQKGFATPLHLPRLQSPTDYSSWSNHNWLLWTKKLHTERKEQREGGKEKGKKQQLRHSQKKNQLAGNASFSVMP